MEKDFHYYLIYSIAKLTQYEDAAVIAYSSQFIDDNNEGQFSIDGQPASFPDKIKSNGGYYYPIMTQSLSPKSLDPYVQKYVYVPFHFLPGDDNVEIKRRKNPLSTTPNSKNAKHLLRAALDTENPYQIGIALHTYADTWSHQNFTGLQEEWNSVYPWYDVFKSMVPNIGHAEAGHMPDVISEEWTDHRFGQKINNRHRALAATAAIYTAMRRRSQQGPKWNDVKKEYKPIIHAAGYDERKERIRDFLTHRGLGSIPKYSKNDWIDQALDKNGGELTMNPEFLNTHWHRFHLAAKSHLAIVLKLIQAL
ncbi:MAG: hypothetical protein HQM14_00330 [SAR324 cluster bacterium]|nr:hypothetical protein [SAR324 cluster bacterium]